MTEQVSLTVMTYNVGNGLAPPERLATYVREANADVVGLQELAAGQAAVIARRLADHYPFQELAGTGFSGRGILSRYPVLEHERLPLAPGRPDLRAVIEVQGRPVTVIVAHPPPPRLRARGIVFDTMTLNQIERLAAVAIADPPAVLLGDFNMTARHPSYAGLAEVGLIDAYLTAGMGRGATFPLRPGRIRRFDHRLSWLPLPPLARLDYIWHTPDLTTLAAWVGEGAGSDHLPVLARLAVSQPAGGAVRMMGEAAATVDPDRGGESPPS